MEFSDFSDKVRELLVEMARPKVKEELEKVVKPFWTEKGYSPLWEERKLCVHRNGEDIPKIDFGLEIYPALVALEGDKTVILTVRVSGHQYTPEAEALVSLFQTYLQERIQISCVLDEKIIQVPDAPFPDWTYESSGEKLMFESEFLEYVKPYAQRLLAIAESLK